jgi:hypothetical protein
LFILKFVCWNQNPRLPETKGYGTKNPNRPNLKTEQRISTRTDPVIEKMKPELSPIFENKGNQNPTETITWKMMQTGTGGSH